MAFKTTGTLLGRIVEMVFPASILGGHMATVAKGIPINIDFPAVGFMTVFTDHTGLVHFALEERGVDIDLILDLSVCKIEILIQKRGPVGIQQGTSVVVIFSGYGSSGVTAG